MDIMYRACVFEYAIHDASPWCAAFDEAELKAIEFREDLDDYYKDAYGLKRNYAQACPIVRELVGRFRWGGLSPEPCIERVWSMGRAGGSWGGAAKASPLPAPHISPVMILRSKNIRDDLEGTAHCGTGIFCSWMRLKVHQWIMARDWWK